MDSILKLGDYVVYDVFVGRSGQWLFSRAGAGWDEE